MAICETLWAHWFIVDMKAFYNKLGNYIILNGLRPNIEYILPPTALSEIWHFIIMGENIC